MIDLQTYVTVILPLLVVGIAVLVSVLSRRFRRMRRRQRQRRYGGPDGR